MTQRFSEGLSMMLHIRRFLMIPVFFFVLLIPAGCMFSQIGSTLPMIAGRFQQFERGLMFWRQDNAVIYVVVDNGRFWELEALEYGLYPENPLQFMWDRYPKPTAQSGFGRVWWNYLDIRYALGEPLTLEIGVYQPIHQFMRGVAVMVLPDGRTIFANQTEWVQIGINSATMPIYPALPPTPYPTQPAAYSQDILPTPPPTFTPTPCC